MARKQLNIILVLLFILACTDAGKEVTRYNKDDIFQLNSSFLIPDSLGISEFTFSVVYKEKDLFFLSEMFTKSMFRVDMKTKEISRFLQYGLGPSEYNGAYGITFDGDNIIFDERRGVRLQKQHINDSTANRLKDNITVRPTKLLFFENKLYFLLGSSSEFNLFNQEGEHFFKQKKVFQSASVGRPPQTIRIFNRDLVFHNAYEAKLFIVTSHTNSELIVNITSMKNSFNWEPLYDSSKKTSFFEEIDKDYQKIDKLAPIKYKSDDFLIVATYTKYNTQELHILNKEYTTIAVVELVDEHLLSSFNGDILTFRISDNSGIEYRQYHIKESVNLKGI